MCVVHVCVFVDLCSGVCCVCVCTCVSTCTPSHLVAVYIVGVCQCPLVCVYVCVCLGIFST